MDAELLERAQKVADMGNRSRGFTGAEFKEIEEVYRLVIGHHEDCYNCVVYRLIREIAKALIQQPKDFNIMAKYQFIPSKRGVKVIRHGENGVTKVITSANLNQSDNAEFILKEYPHLIEEGKASKAREAEEEENEQPEISQEKPEVAPEQSAQSEGEQSKTAAKSAKK